MQNQEILDQKIENLQKMTDNANKLEVKNKKSRKTLNQQQKRLQMIA